MSAVHNHGGACDLCDAQERELERLRKREEALLDALREMHSFVKDLYDVMVKS